VFRLNLSEHAVRNYLMRIFDKLGISSRVELALYAFSSTDGSSARFYLTAIARSQNESLLRKAFLSAWDRPELSTDSHSIWN